MKGTDRPPNSNVYSSASHCHREGKSQGSLNSRSWGIASILKNKEYFFTDTIWNCTFFGRENKGNIFLFNLQ